VVLPVLSLQSASRIGLYQHSLTDRLISLASAPGTYDVVNTIAAVCRMRIVTASSQITIAIPPSATISYASASFCKSAGVQNVTMTGTGSIPEELSAPAQRLSIDASTGAITPSTSTPNTYTVTYTLPRRALYINSGNNLGNNNCCAICYNKLCRIAILYL